MQQQVFTNIPLNEFRLFITDIVNDCLKCSDTPTLPQKEIIDRQVLCKRLDITEPTVIRWEKKGLIPVMKFGGNIRYDWDKVVTALENKKSGSK